MKAADIWSLPEWKKCIAIVFDEVRIREGIVYDKHNSKIVGFVDLGDVNNTLLSFERSSDEKSHLPVAKHILMFMVRGIFLKARFPICPVSYKRFDGRRSIPNCLRSDQESLMYRIQGYLFDRRQGFC